MTTTARLPAALDRRFEAVVVVGHPVHDPLAVDVQDAGGVREALRALWREGVHPCDVLVVDDGTGPAGRPATLRAAAGNAVPALVCAADTATPAGVHGVPAGGVGAVLDDQRRRRAERELPEIRPPRGWGLTVTGDDPDRERVAQALLAVADGRVGISGAPFVVRGATQPRALVAGVFDGVGSDTHLLEAPVLTPSPARSTGLRRVLDLRTGLLREDAVTPAGPVSGVRFATLAAPGSLVVRARGLERPLELRTGPDAPPAGAVQVEGTSGGVCAALVSTTVGAVTDTVASYAGDPDALPLLTGTAARATDLAARGFDALLRDQRRTWASRWEDADVVVRGDADLQLATRLALFHLMDSVADTGEAAVGPRGLTGSGYKGHVFWDADTFVLPFFAATHPASARAMLEYRVRRLPRALRTAQALGRAGARFPWESAHDGDDVTPTGAYDRSGRLIPIYTGEHEEHIVAEVAWAASTYLAWSGDREFARGDGLRLLVETARWWASRVERDADGSAHLRGVIGPDEYHEDVDDNAFTNVMARWNLRRAADAVEAAGTGADGDELRAWRAVADALVDGYDPVTGRHEQFAGFSDLEPVIIAEIARRRPIAADLLMGHERIATTQVIKQADVLMLHHLLPDELPAGSLQRDLAHYEPRTAHGSSLSPGVHAALFARAGQPERALEPLEIAANIDLEDLTGTTASGVHIATGGALWQALVQGFAGVRPVGDRLAVDPHLPGSWGGLDVHLRFRGSRVVVRCSGEDVRITADPPVPVLVRGEPATAARRGLRRTAPHDGGPS